MIEPTKDIDITLLEPYVGQRGIYIEKGLFDHGTLLACRRQPDGLVELDLELRRSLDVASIYADFKEGALLASGYVTWGWVFDPATVARIEARIAERLSAGEDRVDPYRTAWSILEPRYTELNARWRRPQPET